MLPHEKEHEKEAFKKLPLGKKIQHFFDYYLIQTLAVIGVTALAVYLIWNFFIKKHDQYVFAAAVYDEAFSFDKKDAFTDRLRELFELTDSHELTRIDDQYYSGSVQDRMKLTVLLTAGEYDVIVAGEETFRALAGDGLMEDLDELFTKQDAEKFGERYINTPGLLETESFSLNENYSGKGEAHNYGISLKDNDVWQTLGGVCQDPVLGICLSSGNTENAVKFVHYLFDES